MGKLKEGQKRLVLTNLTLNAMVFYVHNLNPYIAGSDENEAAKVRLEPAESKALNVDQKLLEGLLERLHKIEGLRIDIR